MHSITESASRHEKFYFITGKVKFQQDINNRYYPLIFALLFRKMSGNISWQKMWLFVHDYAAKRQGTVLQWHHKLIGNLQ